MGDFNAEPSEPAIQRLMKYGLKSAYKVIIHSTSTVHSLQGATWMHVKWINYYFWFKEHFLLQDVLGNEADITTYKVYYTV